MQDFRYLEGVTTLELDKDTCVGCGMCTLVCPHQVFALEGKKAVLADREACMECGACALNCPVDAISLTPGVGCAALIIKRWLHKAGLAKVSGGCC